MAFFLIGTVIILPWFPFFADCPPIKLNITFPPETDSPLSDLQPIPKFIHITSPKKEHSHAVNLWTEINEDYQVILYNDTEMELFVATEYPEFLNLYDSLYHIVERTDLWRYLIVHARGGFYSDFDWIPKVSIKEWQAHMESKIKHDFNDFPVQVMLAHESFGTTYPNQFIQWGFGGAKGHPLFYETALNIQEQFVDELLAPNVPDPKRSSTYRTGPEIFTRNVYRYLQQNGADISSINRDQSFRHLEVLIGDAEAFRVVLAKHDNHGMGGWKRVNFTIAQVELREKYWGGTASPL